ncbi:uncharacterized protein LOC126376929 [Pectinophora gossypiella]|uniref:uncharacterized protein LOC126376929 n=1 Tax=Pectinophora gossypiella TaxID=13191 RepID=UPI00214EAABE|nr:uncharacterized protein LOC126376929 [Pectinophora gossypiella]
MDGGDPVVWKVDQVRRGCGDHFCTLSPRSTAASIAIISLVFCLIDMLTSDACLCCPAHEHVQSMRTLLLTLFQMANLLLLLATMVESALLVHVYVWYTLAFVLMGLFVSLVDFLLRVRKQGTTKACFIFVPEVSFLFVLFRCLPLVDRYGRDIEGICMSTGF